MCVNTHIHASEQPNPFCFAHMHMCAGLTTWDRTSHVGDHSWRRLVFTWGGAMWGVSRPCWQVNWYCHYFGLVWTAKLLRIHVCGLSVIYPGPWLLQSFCPSSKICPEQRVQGLHGRPVGCGHRECFPCVRGNTGVDSSPSLKALLELHLVFM